MRKYLDAKFEDFGERSDPSRKSLSDMGAREELSVRLKRLRVKRGHIDSIFRHLMSYSRNVERASKSVLVQRAFRIEIKAMQRALAALDKLDLQHRRYDSQRSAIRGGCEGLKVCLTASKDTFEQVYGKRAGAGKGSSFLRGKKPNHNRDLDIFFLVSEIDRAIEATSKRVEKGDFARNLALLFFNSVGFNSQSDNGAVTEKIIRDSFARGKAKAKSMASQSLANSIG